MKLYPAGKTTNAEGGVVDIWDVAEQLRVMEEVDMPLLVHGESAKEGTDPFDREGIFYETAWLWLLKEFPKLRIVAEHITTSTAAKAVLAASHNARVAATITPQHLLVNRAYMLDGMLRPHAFCKPILKRFEDQEELIKLATSGNPHPLGTDSAPHPKSGRERLAKEVDCGCAGCFTAHAALELYAEAFESRKALYRLEDFASRFGADFYELPQNSGTITMVKEEWQSPESYQFGDMEVVPFRQEVPLQWKIAA